MASNRSYSIVEDPARHSTQILYPYGQFPGQQDHLQPLQQSVMQWQSFGSWSFEQPGNQPSVTQGQPMATQAAGYPSTMAEQVDGPLGQPSSLEPVHTSPDTSFQTSVKQFEFLPPPPMCTGKPQEPVFGSSAMCPPGMCAQKHCEDSNFPSFEQDTREYGQPFCSMDENAPIIDLRQFSGMSAESIPVSQELSPTSRRFSESTYSLSSSGGVIDAPAYEDLSASETVSYVSECDAAWTSLEQSMGLLSPRASPSRNELSRRRGRPRVTPLQFPFVRSSPYTIDSTRRTRWSTGAVPSLGAHATGSCMGDISEDCVAPLDTKFSHHQSMPVGSYGNPGVFQFQGKGNVTQYHFNPRTPNGLSPFPPFEQSLPPTPNQYPAQGVFRLLQSNADQQSVPGASLSHLTDLSQPPDLYATLEEEPSNPPESDMNPSDPDLIPREQDLRFAGDLYTPRWVRGSGNKREGWCGLCKPGRWLVLKNSAFWYDKSFTHGVSAATGAAFQAPHDTRRTEGNPDLWEGLCGSCGDWFALISNKKKGTTWFRHAYKVWGFLFSSFFEPLDRMFCFYFIFFPSAFNAASLSRCQFLLFSISVERFLFYFYIL